MFKPLARTPRAKKKVESKGSDEIVEAAYKGSSQEYSRFDASRALLIESQTKFAEALETILMFNLMYL